MAVIQAPIQLVAAVLAGWMISRSELTATDAALRQLRTSYHLLLLSAGDSPALDPWAKEEMQHPRTAVRGPHLTIPTQS